MFKAVSSNVSFPEREEGILAFWDENQIFRKSVEQRAGNQEFVFYDGPPFATGLPHYGHLLAGTIKDVVPRYQTMCGKRVPRNFGWDCHGLPVENEMEKELGLRSKHEIEEYGVDKFNEACRNIVLRHTTEWRRIVTRSGRWVDFDNGYRTMDRDYMESIWWAFRRLWDKGLIYEGEKIMWYCPRCATPLSNFEVNQGYKEVEDPAITLRFQDCDDQNLWFLAWTTTPWTLPANLALAVGAEIDYVEVEDDGQRYILGQSLLQVYWPKEKPRILRYWKGKDLVGREYLPLFPYFEKLREEGAFKIIAADFVSLEEGTGIVHIAPGFGEDDAAVATECGIPSVCPINEEGCYTSEVTDYTGRFVKECDSDIIRSLKKTSALVHRATCRHNYPHCWRCDSILLNKGVGTWFLRLDESLKEGMIQANQQIHWVPEHVKYGRFGKWLENARDWAISRNRYWGCPLPVWRNHDTGETVCVGSVAELEELSGQKISDIHKHLVDPVVLTGEKGGELRRVPEVLDCWFESGAMPYAELHYPFTNRDYLERHFPADFIAEGLDQTRGWFYTLVVLAAALFEKPPFRNVIVNGLLLAEDGNKMSKRLKNYPEPEKIMNIYGADAMRLTMLSSPVVRAEELRFSESAVRDCMRSVLLPFWNAYGFFTTYARVDQWSPPAGESGEYLPRKPESRLDRWILARLQSMVRDIKTAMDDYQIQPAALRFTGFVEDLTNWYIRRSRRRFWKSSNDRDKEEAYQTLYHVLLVFCKVAAPFIPFITEEVWLNLRTDAMPESVHLADFPEVNYELLDPELENRMNATIQAVSLGRYLRSQANIRIRQPLAAVYLVSSNPEKRNDFQAMREVVAEELNVKKVEISSDEEELVELNAKADFRKLGPRLGKKMKEVASLISGIDKDSLHRLREGENTVLSLENGESLAIGPDDIIITRHEKPGMSVANQDDITVAYDTVLSEELRLEGWARELVNRIQNMRKEKNLDVADNIIVRCDLPEPARLAKRRYNDYIAGETLAAVIQEESLPQVEPLVINDLECRITVEKKV